MPTFQESFDEQQLQQLGEQLKYEQGLSSQLAGELAELRNKENAARRILQEIAELAQGQHPEPVDERRAQSVLRDLAEDKAILERRITQSSARMQGIRTQMARLDRPKLERLGKIRGLFQQLTRQQP